MCLRDCKKTKQRAAAELISICPATPFHLLSVQAQLGISEEGCHLSTFSHVVAKTY